MRPVLGRWSQSECEASIGEVASVRVGGQYWGGGLSHSVRPVLGRWPRSECETSIGEVASVTV